MVRQISISRQWLPEEEIEGSALALLRAYEARFGKVNEPPIPIDHLVEGYLGLGISWEEIPEPDGAVILAYIDPAASTICMNTSHREHYERYFGTEAYSLAHEAGHWDLHTVEGSGAQLQLPGEAGSGRFICRSMPAGKPKDRLEWQADRFAAALLMPEAMLQAQLQQLAAYSWNEFDALSHLFQVTHKALRIRLEDLGLPHYSSGGTFVPDRGGRARQATLL